MSQSSSSDPAYWPPRTSSNSSTSTSYSMSPLSDTSSVRFSNIPLPPTPYSSRQTSNSSCRPTTVTDHTIHIPLTKPVNVSFSKGSKVFRLRYSIIELCKDASGALKRIELSEPSGLQSTLIHAFPGTKTPVPHLEQPVTSSQPHVSRISFLEEQTVQITSSTLFQAQPQYQFDAWEDCVAFQEKLLDASIIFTAGMAEAKSKGRGEECISQNLRILRTRGGRQVILFFANSQRKEKKRYISIPLNCVDHLEQSKKSGRPISLTLRPNFDLLAQLKALQILFLDENDQKKFFGLLCHGIGFQG